MCAEIGKGGRSAAGRYLGPGVPGREKLRPGGERED